MVLEVVKQELDVADRPIEDTKPLREQRIPRRPWANVIIRRHKDAVPDHALAAAIAVEPPNALLDTGSRKRQIKMDYGISEAEI
ncbi:MAG: hypothetical protein E5X60_34490, partial [Mesorhizobium sp.]